MIGADGSRLRRIPDVAEYVAAPRWSPDGRLLAVAGLNTCGRACELPGVYLFRADGSRARVVATWSNGLGWSPDGRQLALAAGSLFALDLRSGVTRELVSGKDTVNGNESPTGSPAAPVPGPRDAIASRGARATTCCAASTATTGSGAGAGGTGSSAASGHDRINSRDRAFDVVGCGPGRDTVVTDPRDLVGEDCEIRA